MSVLMFTPTPSVLIQPSQALSPPGKASANRSGPGRCNTLRSLAFLQTYDMHGLSSAHWVLCPPPVAAASSHPSSLLVLRHSSTLQQTLLSGPPARCHSTLQYAVQQCTPVTETAAQDTHLCHYGEG